MIIKKYPTEKNLVRSHFADTEAYEHRIRKYVPSYDDMLDTILDCSKTGDRLDIILELGCGTGNLSHRLLEKNRGCRLIAIDCVPEMIAMCKERLRIFGPRCEIICANMLEFKRRDSFNRVISNLVLHYPETEKNKISVVTNVFSSLKPGGTFSFSAMLTGKKLKTTRRIWRSWERKILRHGVTQKELQEWYATCHGSDHPVSASLWLEWLAKVGFERCELIWRETIFGIFRAEKPLRTRASISIGLETELPMMKEHEACSYDGTIK